ncbi:MAG: Fe-S cluster assembly protein SufD [Vicingaceae bacterium]
MSEDRIALVKGEDRLLKILEKQGASYSQRISSIEAWKKCPIPSRKDEYWKYTRVAPLLNRSYDVVLDNKPFTGSITKDEDAYTLIFVDGHFAPELSDSITEKGVEIGNLDAKPNLGLELKDFTNSKGDYFTLLNNSFYLDGPAIKIQDNCELTKALHIVHVLSESDRLLNVRGSIELGKNCNAKVVERWVSQSANDNLINTVMNLVVGNDSSLEFTKIQAIGKENNLISQEFALQESDSILRINTISLEGKLIRNNCNVRLQGMGSECFLNGLFMGRDNQHIDNHTFVDHAVPHCQSNELYKGVMDDHSKGVFNGKVIVQRDAQKTNAFQYNGNILLSQNAQIYSKPELEIYADDVKCSHGSTTGQLDKEAMFYLQSRGISAKRARQLMVYAFAKEVLEKISLPAIREELDRYLIDRYQIVLDT